MMDGEENVSSFSALDLACKFNHIDTVNLLLRQKGIIVLHDDSFYLFIFYK